MTNAKEIKNIITKIGKANITLKPEVRDYLFNGQKPIEIPKDFYSILLKKFEELFIIQLKENCDKKLINNYILIVNSELERLDQDYKNHRVGFLLRNNKGELDEAAKYTHENITNIIKVQKLVLEKIRYRLKDELEFISYKTSKDYQNDTNSELNYTDITFADSGKLTFNLSKRETLMLIYVLEKNELIKFENDIQRRLFIENNFNYTEMRTKSSSYGEAQKMSGVNKEFSNFSAYTEEKQNTNTLQKILDKLNETIHQFRFKK